MPQPVVDLKNKDRSEVGVQKNPTQGVQASSPEALRWEAPEYITSPKSHIWYGGVISVAALVVLAMALLENYTAAVFFVIATFIVTLYAAKEPRVLEFEIDGRGIRIDERLYAYEELRSFWIFYEPGVRTELSLRSKKTVMPYVHAQLGKVNPAKVHALLSRYLPERRHADSFVDNVSHRIGF
ncbi:MAG: hypothetical protein Q8Q39_06020 [bacterium]|nr:hypothetical protein [bacterium]